MTTAQERLIGALRNHGSVVDDRNPSKIKAQCPAHDDRNPSLSVGPRRDRKGVVVNCHAGCDTPSVLQAINFTMGDLFDEPKVREVFSPRRDYRYPDGRVVHRKANKDFPQSGNLKGKSLFHVDRIGDAHTVYVTEGEKDVEAIERLAGATAVCSPMGAGKAHLFDWEPLRGKSVYIVADRDAPGRAHANDIAGLLRDRAESVQIVEAKSGKDAADHLAAGYTLDELVSVDSPVPNGTPASPEAFAAEEEKPGRRSVAAQLVDMARAEYRLGVTDTDEPFGTAQARPHNAMLLRGGRTGLRAELSRRFFAEHNTVPSQQALADACMVLEGFAAQQAPERVYLRVGQSGTAVYVDMGDTAGRVIHISGGAWTVADTAPVLFRRTKLTGPLPQPQPGSVNGLWKFVGVDEEDRSLVLAWLVAALVQVAVPHPILALLAEQGSAKSTVTRILVSLVDPSVVPLRQPPRDPDGWTTAASASWVVALDNLSGSVPAWLSDCLCRASTGDGNVKRALYTDNDVAVSAFRRCMVVNGVDLSIDRGDLAERILIAALPRVTTRRPEDELATAWEKARPGVLGGLLDLAATVLHRLPSVKVPDLPRMADFAKVLAAVDEVLGTDGLARYREQVTRSAAETLDAPFIAELISTGVAQEDVTAAELLAAVTPQRADWRAPKDWPKNGRAVTGLLTRHAPALRAAGWAVDHDDARNKQKVRRWTLTPPTEQRGIPYPPPPPNPPVQVNGHKFGGSDESGSPASGNPDPPGGSEAGMAGQANSADPPNSPPLNCENGLAGQAGQNPALSLLLNPVKVEGPGRCPECSHHVKTQGHRDDCTAGAA